VEGSIQNGGGGQFSFQNPFRIHPKGDPISEDPLACCFGQIVRHPSCHKPECPTKSWRNTSIAVTISRMNTVLDRPWTHDRFFAWAEAQDPGYEFEGVQSVLMREWTNGHTKIGTNLRYALDSRLDGTACQIFGLQAGVDTVTRAVHYPVAFITCSKVRGYAHTIPGAVSYSRLSAPPLARSTGSSNLGVALYESAEN
jgi:hypothetical protein